MSGRHAMRRSAIAVCLVSSSIAAAPLRADVDIPIPAPCGQLAANSVTNRLYANCGADLVEIDAETHAQRSMPVAGATAGIDMIRNRVVVSTSTSVTVVDVPSWTASVHAMTANAVALDPDTDSIWILQSAAGLVVRLDASTGATTSVSLGATGSSGSSIIVDPVNDLVYASLRNAHRIVEIDALSLATRSLVLASPITKIDDVAIDPLRRLLFVSARGFDPGGTEYRTHFAIDAGSLAIVAGGGFIGGGPLAVDPGSGRLWRGVISDFPNSCGALVAERGTDLAVIGTVSACNTSGPSWSVSPATGRGYLSFGQPTAPPGVTTGAGIAEWDAGPPPGTPSQLLLPNANAASPAVLLSTNRVYVVHTSPFTPASPPFLREHDEAESAPIPLLVAISHGPVQPDGTVVVHFEATSGFATPLPIQQIYYQLDSTDGAWTAASPAGPSAGATIQLAAGAHTLHAFAVDGQEATIGWIQRRNPVTGPVASLAVATPPPPACANGLDDDGDALADFPADPGCVNAQSTRENPQCDNGVDDDGDQAIDHPADTRCRARWDNDEANDPTPCGLGAELVVGIPLMAGLRSRKRPGSRAA